MLNVSVKVQTNIRLKKVKRQLLIWKSLLATLTDSVLWRKIL